MQGSIQQKYEEILKHYLQKKQENDLYEGQQLSKHMIEQGISPEEIVGYHIHSVKSNLTSIPEEIQDSFDFLLEVMIGYGFQYREHQSLLKKQIQLQSELEVAAEMQQTLLPEVPSNLPQVDLGTISVAAKKMSGDYYHFFQDPKGSSLGLGVADIIGKGVPAALCMSMIKYAIESVPEQYLEPHTLLRRINRVVERNIDPSMFITMIYGSYNFANHLFHYATAGHEPGLYYSAKKNEFEDLPTKGVVLGLSPNSTYSSYQKKLEPGDMIILFSDGVTESRREGQFIERQGFVNIMHRYKNLPAQEMVEHAQEELMKWSDFELNDDQTIIVLKRDVL